MEQWFSAHPAIAAALMDVLGIVLFVAVVAIARQISRERQPRFLDDWVKRDTGRDA